MINTTAKHILLDVEGTTSSISFVYDVLFPYARRHARGYLEQSWGQEDLRGALQQMAWDSGRDALWLNSQAADKRQEQIDAAMGEIERLMDEDAKTTGLKTLQGLIWRQGFESGEIRAHVFEDVPKCLRKWTEAGLKVWIYSSGSVQAQKLFFSHTEAGNLCGCISGYYDTTTGPKREAESYGLIARDIGADPSEVVFISDSVPELDAAEEAGMETCLAVRPGNPPIEDQHDHRRITDFHQVSIEG
jgi:enolase-phosphatase E1